MKNGQESEFKCQTRSTMRAVSAKTRSPGAPPPPKRYNKVEALDVFVFLIPCLQLIRITLIGVLNGSDIALLAAFLYLLFRGKLCITTPTGKWTLALCSLWLVSQCVTDVLRHTAFVDYARGWSNIGFTLVSFAALWTLLYGRPRRLVLYGWGLVAGGILHLLLNPVEGIRESTESTWKFGLSYAVTLGVFLLASRKECRGHWPITLAVTMGIVNMMLGSRNAGGECLAAAAFIVVMRLSRRKNPEASRLKTGTVVTLAASILLSLVGVMWIYGRAASAGILGEDAKQKYEQESTGYYGVLLGGRPELLAELPAIYDSPILGHGSWAREPLYIIEQRQALLLLGYKEAALMITPEEMRDGFIPTHSYLFGAWVDAGILGAVFWAWIFVLAVRVLIRVYPETAELLPVVAFLAFLLLWDIPFSPYGTESRYAVPYSIVLMLTFMDMSRRQQNQAATAKNTISAAPTPRRRAASGARASGRSAGLRSVKFASAEGIGHVQ